MRLMESSPRPWMGGHVPWMGTPSMDLSTSRVQHIQAFISSLSLAFLPFSILLAHPTRRFFTLFVDYPQVTGSTSMCKDPWMGIIHEKNLLVLGCGLVRWHKVNLT